MELTGQQKLALPRDHIWAALNDPGILQRCVPGCDVFLSDGPDRYKVGMTAAVGPVKARFQGKLTLSDIVPPASYALGFEGSGGAAGFGKGHARVTLTEEEGGATKLAYVVTAQVGGKLAQVGERLIDGVARKMADEFFARFAAAVTAGEPATAPPGEPAQGSGSSPSASTALPAATAPVPASAAPAGTQGGNAASHSIAKLAATVSVVSATVAVIAAAVAVYTLR